MTLVNAEFGEPSSTINYDIHPVAALFPFIEGDAFREFVEDIRVNGQREPVVLDQQGRLLDGRNRARACQVLGIDVKETRYAGDDVEAWIISHNVHRRHLTESQRAMVGAKLANLRPGNPTGANQHTKPGTPPIGNIPPAARIQDAAKALNVGTSSVSRAKTVLSSGDADLIKSVESGQTSVYKAEQQIKARRQPNEQHGADVRALPTRLAKADVIRDLAAKGYTSEQMRKEVGYSTSAQVRELAKEHGIAIPADVVTFKKRGRDHMRILDNITDSVEVAAMSLRDIDPAQLDEDEALERLDSLTTSISALSKAIKKIKESFHG